VSAGYFVCNGTRTKIETRIGILTLAILVLILEEGTLIDTVYHYIDKVENPYILEGAICTYVK
jgi:hypothetical protein